MKGSDEKASDTIAGFFVVSCGVGLRRLDLAVEGFQ